MLTNGTASLVVAATFILGACAMSPERAEKLWGKRYEPPTAGPRAQLIVVNNNNPSMFPLQIAIFPEFERCTGIERYARPARLDPDRSNPERGQRVELAIPAGKPLSLGIDGVLTVSYGAPVVLSNSCRHHFTVTPREGQVLLLESSAYQSGTIFADYFCRASLHEVVGRDSSGNPLLGQEVGTRRRSLTPAELRRQSVDTESQKSFCE